MRILFILLFLLSQAAASAEVYKRVNPDGSVEFTDIPRNDKEKPLPHKPINTFKSPPPATSRTYDSERQAAPLKYSSIAITSPADDVAVRNNAGIINISVSLTPSLQPNHKLIILMDGNPVGETTTGSFSLNNVDRGTHTISAQVENEKNEILIRADPVTTHLLRRSIL